MKLTPKQKRFVDEYLVDLNATQAAIRSGYSKKRANVIGYENLTKPYISEAIAVKRKQIEKEIGITRERIVKEMANLAFFNVKSFYDVEGGYIPVHKLDDDVASAINGIDVVTIGNGDVGIGKVMKYKIPDKNKSLENLAKMLGYMDRDRTREQSGTERLIDAMVSFAGKMPS